MRYVAIDLGDQRTGIASGDTITRVAAPVRVIECPIDRAQGRDLLQEIRSAVDEQIGLADNPAADRSRAAIVLGLPINMDGSIGPRAKLIELWAKKISDATGWKVHLFDERLSSARAELRLNQSGLTHKQKKLRRDAIAAAVILQGFLDTLSS